MRFVGRGHEHIRATHAKTLELSTDADITARATCVIAVQARPTPPLPVAGPVRIHITAGGEAFTLHARANPSWDPAGPAVIRRSPLRLPGTLATHADTASSDLPAPLVAALQSPDAVVEVTVEPNPGTSRTTIVLFAADPARGDDPRLSAELAVADVVVSEDDDARRLARNRGSSHVGARILVVAVRDLPGASVGVELADAEVDIETVGLPARLAAGAASPSRGPLVLAPDGADPRDLLRTTPAGHRLVLTSGPADLPALIALAAQVRGSSDAVLCQEHAPPVRIDDGRLPGLASNDTVHVCFAAQSGAAGAVDPAVRAAINTLLGDGVPTRTAAKALAALSGWERRRAYDTVLDWRSTTR